MNRSLRLTLFGGGALAAVLAFGAVRDGLGQLAGQWNPFRLTSRVAATGPVVLDRVQRLQRLETCRYNGQVIVRGDTQSWLPTWMAGDRMLFVGRGEVVAGVDLAGLSPADVRVQGNSVTLKLPETQILHTRLDNQQSQVFERRSGFLSGPDHGLETRVRVEAENKIREAAVESGVLATARENAQDTLRGHLESLGFRDVRFL